MKKCPFCAEEIQDDAIKCRYCGSWIDGRAEGAHTPAADADPVDQEARTLADARRKIDAIKLIRAKKGLGLAEAKAYVERLQSPGEGLRPESRSGCTSAVLLALLVGIGIAWSVW